jgi:uncharacterized membrane protein YbhN (UPF0104 family)
LASKAVRKWVLFWVKIAVSVLVLYLVFRGTDLALISNLLTGSRKLFWAAAFFLMVLSQVISTLRWHILLKPLDFDLPWFRVFRIYFTGMFFSLFLPTLVGGDAVKTYSIAFPVWPFWLTLGLALFVPLTYGLLLLLPRLSTRALLLVRRLREVPRERLFVYWEDWRTTARAWMLSLGIHLCLVISHVCLAYALGLDVPWVAWAAVYPVTALVGFLPISLSGVGPREAAYVFLIGLFGISREMALAYGIMWFSMVLGNGLVGGLFYVFGGELNVRDAVRT